MKKYFLTGLAILLPGVLTFMILLFIVNLLTKPFIGAVEHLFEYYGVLDNTIFLKSDKVIRIISRLLILLSLFGVTLFIGMLGRIVLFHYIIRLGNYILHRIPFVNKIYKAIQEVMKTIFENNSPTFSQVVLVPFPSSKCYSVGFITNASEALHPKDDSLGNISVFVPATPNPTVGFMLLYKMEQMIYLDTKVEDALKFIVSCAVIDTELKES